jgi:2-oxo-4-hydroxy-4-carboxy-5-ureidoimidazoline decarboxylase
MTLNEFNRLDPAIAKKELFRCCGSTKWTDEMMKHFPFKTKVDMKLISDRIWLECKESDWLEAFSHHPKIGEAPADLHAATSDWAKKEQSNVGHAGKNILDKLSTANKDYENKFGYVYIVSATGKNAVEILSNLQERLKNEPEKEMHISSAEQNKITHIRIDKLIS